MNPGILREVTHIYTHAKCADGRAAARILHEALPDAKVRELAYDMPEHVNLVPHPGALFCDIAPWAPKLSEEPTEAEHEARTAAVRQWVDVEAIVLDHHTLDLVEPFHERGVFGKNEWGESGARLAFEEVACEVLPGHIAKKFGRLSMLSAIYDTWKQDDSEWHAACWLAALLQRTPLSYVLEQEPENLLSLASTLGAALHVETAECAIRHADTARLETVGGFRVAVVPTPNINAVADELRGIVDIVAGFDYLHTDGGKPRLKWSLRSRDVDVRAIARRNGGNGHKNAAGFVIADNGRSPYARIVELIGNDRNG